MTKFPQSGLTKEVLFDTIASYKEKDGDWEQGKTWSLVYYAGEEITQTIQQVYQEFSTPTD